MFELKNIEGNRFIAFMNIFFLVISIAVYFKGASDWWIKFNFLFIGLSLFLFLKKGNIFDEKIQVFYPLRFLYRRININASEIKRITLSFYDYGQHYPNIAIITRKFPFYLEFRLDSVELENKEALLTKLKKLQLINPKIKVKIGRRTPN